MQLAAPSVRFRLKLHTPPLPDESGGFFYISPPRAFKDVGSKAVSAARRDLMTSIVAVGRELVSTWPRVVLGHGQGGLVAVLAAFPRILESALAIVYAREPEGVQIADAWRNVRAFVAISPRLHSLSSSELLEKAIPELGRVPLGCEAPAPIVVVGRAGPWFQFARRVAELTRASFVSSVGDALFQSAIYAPPLPPYPPHG